MMSFDDQALNLQMLKIALMFNFNVSNETSRGDFKKRLNFV